MEAQAVSSIRQELETKKVLAEEQVTLTSDTQSKAFHDGQAQAFQEILNLLPTTEAQLEVRAVREKIMATTTFEPVSGQEGWLGIDGWIYVPDLVTQLNVAALKEEIDQ